MKTTINIYMRRLLVLIIVCMSFTDLWSAPWVEVYILSYSQNTAQVRATLHDYTGPIQSATFYRNGGSAASFEPNTEIYTFTATIYNVYANDVISCKIMLNVLDGYTGSVTVPNTPPPPPPTYTVSINCSNAVSVDHTNQIIHLCDGRDYTFTASSNVPYPSYYWIYDEEEIYTSSLSGSGSSFTVGWPAIRNGAKIKLRAVGSGVDRSTIYTIAAQSLIPSVSVAATNQSICSGTNVTFTATPTNGGTSPQYQWMKNDVNISGATAASYTTTSLANNDKINVRLTSNEACATSSSVTSKNPITMTVRSKLTPEVSISSPATSICPGNSVEFTATPTNGGTSPQYQWIKGSSVVQTTTTNKWSTTSIANNDKFTVKLISSESCVTSSTVTSTNSVTMTLKTKLTPTVSMTASPQPVYQGNPVTFKATPTNGGTTPQYQWMKGSSAVQTTTTNEWSTTSVTNGDKFSVKLTSSESCVTSSTATSNVITMSVTPFTTIPLGLSAGQNYILTVTPLDETDYLNIASNQITIPQGTQAAVNVQYFDGLGRPMQTVAVGASPDRKDIVTPIVYDNLGRQDKQFLPYVETDNVAGTYRPAARSRQKAFYNAPPTGIPADAAAFDSTVFEPSPLGRIVEHYGPGTAWRTTAGQPLRTKYSGNTVQVYDCRKTATGASFSHRYAVGTLHQVDTYDENNNITATEYIDLQGKLVRRIERGDRGRQYVFDDFGRVVYVLAPNVSSTSFTETDNTFKSCVFAYRYDSRGRVVRKHIPGAGWSSIVYNKLDQPVMTQDSVQRVNNQWSFTKYDAHGRVVITGTITSSADRKTWTTLVEAAAQWEQRSTASGNVAGYTKQSEPKSITEAANVHQVHYYDTYKNYPLATHCSTCSNRTQGLPTESRTRELGTSTFRNSSVFYDEKGRVVRTKQQTAKGDDITNYTYDFTGKVTKNVRSFGGTTIETEQDYDHAGRPTDTRMKAGTSAKVTTVRNEYNGLGQVIRKNLHSADNGASWLQQVDYSYNIRGWLTAINPDEDASDAYIQKLYYQETKPSFFASSTKRYNGDITGISWKTKAPGAAAKTYAHAYAFSYNTYEWLSKAAYTADTTGRANVKHYANRYNEEFAYNKTGNLTSLKRRAKGGIIDSLTYQYASSGSPLLTNITENLTTTLKDLGFKANISTLKYTYDVSGRLTNDLNKGVDITYNHLNLPETVTSTSDNQELKYTYLADGRRVKRTFNSADRFYIDGYEYEGGTLKFVAMPEGRIRKTGTGTGDWTYDYFIKDHLGNVRVALTTAPSTQQTYMATMEEGNAATENTYFNNIESTRADRPYNYPDKNPTNAKLAKVPGKSKGPSIMLRVMAGDTVSISAKAFYNIDKTLPGQGVDIAPVLGSAIAAMTNPASAAIDETTRLAMDLGATASTSAVLKQAPVDDNRDENVQPESGINFVLYNADFEVVPENTGVQLVDDKINTIQTLSTDQMVIQENGFLEVFVNNEAQTPVFFDNLMVTHTPSRVLEVNSYYPSGLLMYGADMTFQAAGDEYNGYKYNSKELQTQMNLGWLDYGARMYDPAIMRWMVPDPLAEMYYNTNPYMYVLGNPINNFDPNGLSTHTDSTGRVIAVYNDDDLGVYSHDQLPEEYAAYDGQTKRVKDPVTGKTKKVKMDRLSGGEKKGETGYWDEFINPESGKIDGQIKFGESFDAIINNAIRQAEGMDIRDIATSSRPGGIFDIKNRYANEGRLLDGKYVTSRSAGNYLAGFNASRSTLFGQEISFETFQRLAGALHVQTERGKSLSKLQMADIVLWGIQYGPPPTYGENIYQYRMSRRGWLDGRR